MEAWKTKQANELQSINPRRVVKQIDRAVNFNDEIIRLKR